MRAAVWFLAALLCVGLWPAPWWWKYEKWQDLFLVVWLFRWAKEEINSKTKQGSYLSLNAGEGAPGTRFKV